MSYTPKNPNGQATMANSSPVALASDQSSIPVAASLAAGTNNIGDVDILTVPADPFGVNADAASATGSISAKLRFIASTGIPITGTVTVGSHAVTNAGTFVTQENGAALTSLQLLDDVVATLGTTTYTETTSKGNVIAAVRRDADTTLVDTTNEFGPLQMDANGRLKVEVFSGETLPVSLTSTTITGTVAVTKSGTWDITNAGTFAVQAAQSGTWTVQPGNTANTTPWLVTQSPATSGGLTTFHLVSAATTNATNVKASAGQLYGYYIYNSNASARKVAFHNTSGTPTAGASVFFSIVIPPTAGANVSFASGIAFSSGIGITTVTGLADNDSAAVALNDLVINLFYK